MPVTRGLRFANPPYGPTALLRYRRQDGREPFTEWLNSLRDKAAQARIRVRLRQVEAGNFGDSQPVGEGVVELRVHLGAGYRVYFGRHGRSVVLLLCGGDKGSQASDIKQAKALWSEWKRRQT
jgi:putative addiction module killer protein